MQSSFTQQLSEYQKAVLNEMGVSLWRHSDNVANGADQSTQHNVSASEQESELAQNTLGQSPNPASNKPYSPANTATGLAVIQALRESQSKDSSSNRSVQVSASSDTPVDSTKQTEHNQDLGNKAISRAQELDAVPTPTESKTSQLFEGGVLLALPSDAAQAAFVQDVLAVLSVEPDLIKTISENELANYQGYRMAWRIGNTLSLSEKLLTTPPLAQMQDCKVKRLLWQLLQHLDRAADI